MLSHYVSTVWRRLGEVDIGVELGFPNSPDVAESA